MATLTTVPPFTSGADVRIDLISGWDISPFSIINAFAGADTISGAGSSIGVQVRGELYAGAGDDVISGTGSYCGLLILYPSSTNTVVLDTGTGNDAILGSGGDYGILNYTTILTDFGDDTLTASGAYIGFNNVLWYSVLDTSGGNDSLVATSNAGDAIINSGTIYTGEGNDTISGSGFLSGITNFNAISMEGGNDQLIGSGGGSSSGLYNDISGTINSGTGSDSLVGSSSGVGSGIENKGFLTTDQGNDTISGSGGRGVINQGTIDTGSGNDQIDGFSSLSNTAGIHNYGTINTADGNDTVSSEDDGIFNNGLLDTGNGNDLINALNGGFSGTGTIQMGAGNDTLMGFGSGIFDGGSGNRDRILFGGDGIYTITMASGSGSIILGSTTMAITQFESIGGVNGGLFALPLSSTSPLTLSLIAGVASIPSLNPGSRSLV